MKTRYPATLASEVAHSLVALLQHVCERITIAGSLRRGKSEVGDVEILFVPKIEQRPDGLFDTQQVDLAALWIDKLLADGVLQKRPSVIGRFAWGLQNKLAIHTASGIPVDFFSTTEAHWFVSLIIRTGPAQFNPNLIMSLDSRGYKLHAYGPGTGLVNKKTGEDVIVTSEEQILHLAGMKYFTPEERRA